SSSRLLSESLPTERRQPPPDRRQLLPHARRYSTHRRPLPQPPPIAAAHSSPLRPSLLIATRRRPLPPSPPSSSLRCLRLSQRRLRSSPFSVIWHCLISARRCLLRRRRRLLHLCLSFVQSALFYTAAFSSRSMYSVYESAKNQMLTGPLIPPIDEAYSRLSRIPISAATVPDTTSAMLATRGRGGPFFARGRGGRGRGNTPLRPVCQFCHCIGHTMDKCWQKHGRPAFANQTVSTDSPDQPTPQHTASSSDLCVDDIISQLRNLIGDRAHQAPDPPTSTVTTAASASSSGMYFVYTVCPATDTINWLIDSGASTHLCGDKAQFTSYVPTPPGRSIGAFVTPDAPGLPKARSGNIMRRILRKIASRQLEDPSD
ncbi:Acetyl-coenzyme A synthetase, partial [Nymphaea thermarum]